MQLGYVHAHRILKANHAVKYVKPMPDGLCHVSNYLGRIPKSRCCTNYKVVVYRIGQTSPVPPPVSHFLPPPLAPPFPHSPSPIPRPPIPRSPIPRSPIPRSPIPRSPIPGFKDSRFQSISRFSTEKTIFLPVFNLQTLKTSLLLVFYSYSTRMYLYVLVFYSYVTRMYSCVTRMYSYVTRMYSYVTRMYSCVTRMYSYVTRMYSCVTRMYSYVLVCYSYVTRMYSCGVLVTISGVSSLSIICTCKQSQSF